MDHGFKMARERWTEEMMDAKTMRKNVEGKGKLRHVRINKEVGKYLYNKAGKNVKTTNKTIISTGN